MEIRKTLPEDIPAVRQLEADPENRRWVYQWSEAQHRAALEDRDTGHWMLTDARGQTVGYCILKGLENPFGTVELMRIVIGPKGRGYGRAALQAIMARVFAELKARRLWLDVVSTNERAIRLYESLGFVHEGTLRESALIDGEPASMRLYGLLAREWRAEAGNRTHQ